MEIAGAAITICNEHYCTSICNCTDDETEKRKRKRPTEEPGEDDVDDPKKLRMRRLPDDLVVFELLMRLPIKDLHLCKNVSKSWCSIIRHPLFIQAHHYRHRNGGLLISVKKLGDGHGDGFCFRLFPTAVAAATARSYFYYSTLEVQDGRPQEFFSRFDVPSCDFYEGVTQVVNGLVCFYDRLRVSVCNVCTKQTMMLPHRGFEPRPKTTKYFFGFDPIDRVYKLLKVSTVYGHPLYRRACEILTLGCDSLWRELPDVLAPLNSSDTRSFLVNGVLYWMHGLHGRLESECFLVSFDLNKEIFRSVKLPPVESRLLLWSHVFVQFRGRLALTSINDGDVDRHKCLCLYTLEDEDGNSWTMDFIEFSRELRRKQGGATIPVGNLPTGQILLANPLAKRSFTPVYSYDHQSNKF